MCCSASSGSPGARKSLEFLLAVHKFHLLQLRVGLRLLHVARSLIHPCGRHGSGEVCHYFGSDKTTTLRRVQSANRDGKNRLHGSTVAFSSGVRTAVHPRSGSPIPVPAPTPAPSELTPDQVADLVTQVVAIRQKFNELCCRGVGALCQMPAPFPSLKASDKEWISEGVATEKSGPTWCRFSVDKSL